MEQQTRAFTIQEDGTKAYFGNDYEHDYLSSPVVGERFLKMERCSMNHVSAYIYGEKHDYVFDGTTLRKYPVGFIQNSLLPALKTLKSFSAAYEEFCKENLGDNVIDVKNVASFIGWLKRFE